MTQSLLMKIDLLLFVIILFSIVEAYFRNSLVTSGFKLLLNHYSCDRNGKQTIDKETQLRVMKQVIEIDFNNGNNYYSHSTNKDVIKYTVILDELIKVAAKSKENNDIQASIDKSQFDEVFLSQRNNANDKRKKKKKTIHHVFKTITNN